MYIDIGLTVRGQYKDVVFINGLKFLAFDVSMAVFYLLNLYLLCWVAHSVNNEVKLYLKYQDDCLEILLNYRQAPLERQCQALLPMWTNV